MADKVHLKNRFLDVAGLSWTCQLLVRLHGKPFMMRDSI